MSPEKDHYAIRGGVPGRERLRVLSRVMHLSTTALFERLDVREGMICLDAGCGGGDVTCELARRAGPQGRVLGIDMDETKLDLVRREAEEQQIRNASFRALDIRSHDAGAEFDLVYARFLLTHLDDPCAVVAAFRKHVRPGGLIALEDIDSNGSFIYPESSAFRRYHELYCTVVRRRGGDPNIGPRLPAMLLDVCCDRVKMNVVQPAAMAGEVKLVSPLTLENIADAVLAAELASRAELDQLIAQLYEFARDSRSVMSIPRVVQAWGRRPD